MINSKKEQSGITLIALVVTIVVLLILAGIAISMISSNNGVLTKATDAKKANEQGTDGDRVRLAAQSALIDGEGVINTTAKSGKGSLYAALIEEFGSEKILASNYAEGRITLNGKSYTVTSTGSVEVSDESSSGYEQKQWTLTTDSGDIGLSVGDLITYKDKTSEQFYVIGFSGENNTTVKVLAAKNITTTGTLEQSDSAGRDSFSNSTYWSSEYQDAEYHSLNLNDFTGGTDAQKAAMGVTSTDAIEIARAYARKTFGVTGRLMTLEEIEDKDIGGDSSTSSTSGCPPFINSTNYWLGSAWGVGVVWSVYGNEEGLIDGNYCMDHGYGVRPVLEISAYSIELEV